MSTTRRRRSPVLAAAVAALVTAGSFSPARAAGDTTIEINFVETHDRLPPDERLGIVGQHQIVATLSAGNRVSENNQAVFGRRNRSFVKQGQNSESLGDNSARAVWRVLGPHQLRRIFAGGQFLTVMDIAIGEGNSCSVAIKFLLQKGYADIVSKRADNGELAHFSLPKLVSSQCSIR